jgi:hypothetical protein
MDVERVDFVSFLMLHRPYAPKEKREQS